MKRSVKILAAVLILAVGVGLAMLYPRATSSSEKGGGLAFRFFRSGKSDVAADTSVAVSNKSTESSAASSASTVMANRTEGSATPYAVLPQHDAKPTAPPVHVESPPSEPPQVPSRIEPSSMSTRPAASTREGRIQLTPQLKPIPPLQPQRAATPRYEAESTAPTGNAPPNDDVVRDNSRPTKTHTIVDGDTLRRLALRYFGDPERSGDIFAANRNTLAQPDLLPIGAKLVIPNE